MIARGGDYPRALTRAIGAAFAMLAAIALAAPAFAQTAGTATAVSGQVQLQRAGATSNLAQGATVQVGDRITTGPASSATITLTDQSQLEIHDSSTVTIDQHLVGAGGRVSTQVGLVSGLSSLHTWENGVTATEIDLRTVALSTEKFLLLAGAGGAFWVGGITNGSAGQGGPDVTVLYRPWQLGFMT